MYLANGIWIRRTVCTERMCQTERLTDHTRYREICHNRRAEPQGLRFRLLKTSPFSKLLGHYPHISLTDNCPVANTRYRHSDRSYTELVTYGASTNLDSCAERWRSITWTAVDVFSLHNCTKNTDVHILLHSLFIPPISHYNVWSVISGHNLAKLKHDNW